MFTIVDYGLRTKSNSINELLTPSGNTGIDATLTGYNVYRDAAPLASNIPDLFYDDLGLAVGNYSYTVTAQYTEGESDPAGPVEATIVDPNLVTLNVYPLSAAFWTGNTEGTIKTDGEINTVFPNYAWAMFDISGIPSGVTITSIKFNGYVNDNNWPYWGITPMGTVNPVTDDAATIFTAVDDGTLNEYSFSGEPGTLPLDWLTRDLTGTAATDMETALTQGWFAIGFWDDDGSPTWYINFDGWSQTNPPYLEVTYLPGGGTTFPLDVTVMDGWNMVSIPGLHPTNQDVTTWWSNLSGSVFEFDAGYQPVTSVVPSEGYWMNNSGGETYSYPEINIVPHDPIAVPAGWSMIGGYENIAPVSSLIPSAGTILSVFEFGTGYATATDLVPGYGYWINMSEAGTITIPDPTPLPKGSGEVVEYFKEDWGKIIITDNAGRSYTLYAVKGEVDLDYYELPPMPPVGMFDIRYGSDRIAEDINSTIQSIEMSGLEYPVIVKVDGMDIRLQDETGNQIDENIKSGEEITISNAQINKLMVTGELIPDIYALEQNYPNPFNPSTVIEFSLPEDVSNVQLTIYDILGQRVAQLVNTSLQAGKYQYQWNAGNVSTGMYIYELRADKFVSVKKMVLMK